MLCSKPVVINDLYELKLEQCKNYPDGQNLQEFLHQS